MIPLNTLQRFLYLCKVITKNVILFWIKRLALLIKKSGMPPDRYENDVWHLKGRMARITFEEMGATFIKLAQILSTRRDLFPPATLEEFEKLQDDVPPFDGNLVPSIFRKDFGKSIETEFDNFDLTPVASASVAQVHRGILKNGKEVAVKVLRPGIEATMVEDLKLIYFLVRLITKIPILELRSLIGFTEHFGEMLKKQLDLTIEAENNRRYRECFKNDMDRVRFPELVDTLCSKNIMTMEFVRGVKPTDKALHDYDKQKLAESGLYLYYAMALYGLIHADLHPGNMLVTPDYSYWIFDLGLVDELDWEWRKNFFEVWFSSFNGEGAPFARLILKFSISHKVEDMEAFENDVSEVLQKYVKQRDIRDLEFGKAMMALGDIQRKYKIVASPVWTSIGVSLVSIEGLARHFDPGLNIARTISPHLKKFLRKIYLMDPKLKNKRSKTGERLIKADMAV